MALYISSYRFIVQGNIYSSILMCSLWLLFRELPDCPKNPKRAHSETLRNLFHAYAMKYDCLLGVFRQAVSNMKCNKTSLQTDRDDSFGFWSSADRYDLDLWRYITLHTPGEDSGVNTCIKDMFRSGSELIWGVFCVECHMTFVVQLINTPLVQICFEMNSHKVMG